MVACDARATASSASTCAFMSASIECSEPPPARRPARDVMVDPLLFIVAEPSLFIGLVAASRARPSGSDAKRERAKLSGSDAKRERAKLKCERR